MVFLLMALGSIAGLLHKLLHHLGIYAIRPADADELGIPAYLRCSEHKTRVEIAAGKRSECPRRWKVNVEGIPLPNCLARRMTVSCFPCH